MTFNDDSNFIPGPTPEQVQPSPTALPFDEALGNAHFDAAVNHVEHTIYEEPAAPVVPAYGTDDEIIG